MFEVCHVLVIVVAHYRVSMRVLQTTSQRLYMDNFFFVFFNRVAKLRERPSRLHAGTPLVSPAELAALDAEVDWMAF